MSSISYSFSMSIHAVPAEAEAHPNGVLNLYFDQRYGLPCVTLHTGSDALASDLAEAINTVIEKHAASRQHAA